VLPLGDSGSVKVVPSTLPPAHSCTLNLGSTEVQEPLPAGDTARAQVAAARPTRIWCLKPIFESSWAGISYTRFFYWVENGGEKCILLETPNRHDTPASYIDLLFALTTYNELYKCVRGLHSVQWGPQILAGKQESAPDTSDLKPRVINLTLSLAQRSGQQCHDWHGHSINKGSKNVEMSSLWSFPYCLHRPFNALERFPTCHWFRLILSNHLSLFWGESQSRAITEKSNWYLISFISGESSDLYKEHWSFETPKITSIY
jgi:hypothetical protein